MAPTLNLGFRHGLWGPIILLAGCGFRSELPPGTAVACQADADCISGLVCSPAGRCISSDALSVVPPALEEGSNVSPERARAGDVVEVTFRVKGTLEKPPEVFIDLGTERVPLVTTEVNASTQEQRDAFRFIYPVSGNEPQGTHVISANFTAFGGTKIVGLLLGEVVFDFDAPSITSITTNAHHVRSGVKLRIQVALDEGTSDDGLRVTLVKQDAAEIQIPMRVETTTAANDHHEASIVPTGNEAEGVYRIDMETQDDVGNTQVSENVLTVAFDFTAPMALLEPETALPPVSPERPFSVAFALTEIPTDQPVLGVRSADGETPDVPFTPIGTGGVAWLFTSSFPTVAPESDYDIVMGPLTDEAGNTSDPKVVGRIRYDKTPPLLVRFEPLSAAVRADETLAVTFEVTEALGSIPVVRLGDAALSRDDSVMAPSFRYTLDLSMTVLTGVQLIDVVLEDVAHNVTAGRYGVVVIDNTRPDVLGASFLPPRAGAEAFVVLTVVVDGTLATTPSGEPNLTLQFRDGRDPGFSYLSSSGFSHTYGMRVTDDVNDGSYTLDDIVLVDDVGNTSRVQLGQQPGGAPLLVVDKTPPVVADLSLNATVRSAVEGFDTLDVGFTLNEPLDGASNALTVRMGERSLPCAPIAPMSPAQRCTGRIRADDPEGQTVVTIEARDAAGNLTTQAIAFEVDLSPPELLAASFVPRAARVGSFVTLSLVANEPLAEQHDGSPAAQLTWFDHKDPFLTFLSRSGSTHTYGREVTADLLEGSYHLQAIEWTDIVGNSTRIVDDNVSSPDTVRLPSWVIDQVGPVISNLHANAETFSAVPGFNTLQVAFDVDEELASTAAALAVVFDGRRLSCGPFSPSRPNYTCTTELTPNDSEGQHVVTVQAQDEAGNLTITGLPVNVDHTPPAVVEIQEWRISPPLAGVAYVSEAAVAGSTAQLALRTREAVDSAGSTLVAVSDSDDSTIEFRFRTQEPLSGGDSMVTWDMRATDVTVGTYTLFASFRDLFGNLWESTVELPAPGLTVVESDRAPCLFTRADGSTACTDFDGDGFLGVHGGCPDGNDCNDTVASAFPSALEIPGDGVDNDCLGDGDAPLDNVHAVFVSPDGREDGAGTMEDPLARVTAAVTRAGTTRAVALRAGTYSIDAGIAVRGLVGGLDSSWNRTTDVSVLTTTRTLAELGGFGELVSMRGFSFLEGVEVRAPSQALSIASDARAMVVRSTFITTDPAAGNGPSTVDVSAIGFSPVRTFATFVDSTIDAGDSGNDAFKIDAAASLRIIDSHIRASQEYGLVLSGDATAIRTRIESRDSTGVFLSTYARSMTAIASVIRSHAVGFSGRGVRMFNANSVFEGFLTTVVGGSAMTLTDTVPVSARCIGCMMRGGVSLKAGATYGSIGSTYVPACAVRYAGSCISTAETLDQCDPAWCTEARDNAVTSVVLDDISLAPSADGPVLEELESFEALGLPASAVLDISRACVPPTGFVAGAYQIR